MLKKITLLHFCNYILIKIKLKLVFLYFFNTVNMCRFV